MSNLLAENKRSTQEIQPGQDLARNLVEDTSVLVSPPDIYLKINEMLGEDHASAEEFSDLIACDPSLTARLLKLVNSSYYALPSKVDTISRALTVVGLHELTNLVYSVCAVKTFSQVSSEVTNMSTFWRHGVYCGLTAKALARCLNCLNPERLFVAGLLHDVGSLAINRSYPEIAETTITASAGSEVRLAENELAALGFTHAELGAMMFENWNLPQPTCTAIRFHHQPELASASKMEATILHMADEIANLSGTGSYSETITEHTQLDYSPLKMFGLPADFDSVKMLEEVDQQFIETIYLLIS